MFTIRHSCCGGWEILKNRVVWSCVYYQDYDDAVVVLAMHGLKPTLKCETCGSIKNVQPEQLNEESWLMSCIKCRNVVIGPSIPEGRQGKRCKKTHVVREISPMKFRAKIKQGLRLFGMKSTGSPSLDKTLTLPHAARNERHMSEILDWDELPDGCQLCGTPFTLEFVDGVIAHAGAWAYMCCSCHRENGTGLGIGHGTKYTLGHDNRFHKVDINHKEVEPGTKCHNPNCQECNADATIKRP